MLKLSGKVFPIKSIDEAVAGIPLKISTDPSLPVAMRRNTAFLQKDFADLPSGFDAYLISTAEFSVDQNNSIIGRPIIKLPAEFYYLADGDVVSLSPKENRIRVLFRLESPHNSFLVTERCDNYCLMCSQPPKDVNDDWVVEEILDAIPLIDKSTKELGFTGGEPTLLGEKLLDILTACKGYLPDTAIHVLSNGRRFSDESFTKRWASIKHSDLMVGIPVYSDISTVHDYVVQADGAFDQTLKGILNLKKHNQRVEIRVVLHKQTVTHLSRLADFISRNLLFVDHVALMGLEMMGFTRANMDQLWIDPTEYQAELHKAVRRLADAGMRVSIYNHQLCLLDRRLWPYAVKSISDWKNEYFPECNGCSVKDQCGGFFSSAIFKRSDNIHAIDQP